MPVSDLERAVAFYRDTLGMRFLFQAPPGLVARMADHELWMAFFYDPDQNLLALMCEKR